MIKKYFTSNYDKRPQSNFSKIVKIISDELDDIKNTYHDIDGINDIDKAEGQVLDIIGGNILQYRGGLEDELYRAMVKTKLQRNKADGTLADIVTTLSQALGVAESSIILREDEDADFPIINEVQVPLSSLARLAMTSAQLGQLINSMISAGVQLEVVIFIGSFGFGGLSLEGEIIKDYDTGYADVDMTSGGDLGAEYTPGDGSQILI